ncbi:GNAT family N-acetyltransferase [Sediminicoccus sp. KRV36]|uniref:GNAT family N-acetyltransferase n=1 Tax=Sediminicoccus sp. KRV36 TaxID=3133721 RepID=UPI00200BCB1E|nr:GNAT family N-acetyltransferase [Sediminicoccus rosea]UPY36558.1 N-acetyltransferase family protein [Sediminicoccus rosea]
MIIRDAVAADLADITAIYAHHVLTGTGTFEESPPDTAEIAARMAKVQAAGCAWLVAENDGVITGYGYYAQIRDRSAYRFTAEDSIYVRDDVRGMGVGKALVLALLEHATARGFRQMIAVIGDSENVGSIGLHSSLGFRQVGTMKAVGLKFGQWVDVVTMQRPLGEGEQSLPTG